MLDLIFDFFISDNTCYNKELFEDIFKLPIEYLDEKYELNNTIKNDLELNELKNQDISNTYFKENLYSCIFNPKNNIENNLCNRWNKYYTNNKNFLLDTQNLLKNYKNTIKINENEQEENIDKFIEKYEKIVYDSNFIDRYQYFNFPILKKYNNNEQILFINTCNNICSPIFNLLLPIILLLLPFFIIKLGGYDLTLDTYYKYLKNTLKHHALGNIVNNNFWKAPFSTKIYIILSIAFYIFSIYQNTIECIKYYNNIKFINEFLIQIKDYLNNSILNINNLLKYTKNLKTYKYFHDTSTTYIQNIHNYLNYLNKITEYKISFKKIFELGNIMKCFYHLHNEQELINILYYCFGCNTFIHHINKIQKHIKDKNINFCEYINLDQKTEFNNAYYGFLLKDNQKIIKNSYKLNNNLLLTGPNAGGKTTLLKSTIFNIILCQQIGCGFFDSAKIKLYDYFHCYINIPDTSDRDSLFQAEARQCKEILDFINNNKNKIHFCVFDELYTGTNPEDSISSAINFIKFLNKNNVELILTTHYIKICKELEKYNKINKSYHMNVEKDINDNFIYKYKIKKGISKIRGGIKVLKDLNYPDDIIKNIK